MLLQSERVSEMHFQAIWRPKLPEFSLWYQPWKHLMEIVNYANNKETESLGENSLRQKCLDKSLKMGAVATAMEK